MTESIKSIATLAPCPVNATASGNNQSHQSPAMCPSSHSDPIAANIFDPDYDRLVLTLLIIFTVVGVIMNLMVAALTAAHKSLQTLTSVFIIMGVTVNILISLVILPVMCIIIIKGTLDDELCTFMGFSYVCLKSLAFYSMVCLAIDQCVTVLKPLRHDSMLTGRAVASSVAISLTVCVGMALVPILWRGEQGEAFEQNEGKRTCVPSPGHHWMHHCMFIIGGILLPMLIILVAYLLIGRVAWQQARRGKIVCDENHCRAVPSRRKEIKALLVPAVMSGTFCLIWMPYTVTNLWAIAAESRPNVYLDSISEILTLSTVVVYPCQYALLFPPFRMRVVQQWRRLVVLFRPERPNDALPAASSLT